MDGPVNPSSCRDHACPPPAIISLPVSTAITLPMSFASSLGVLNKIFFRVALSGAVIALDVPKVRYMKASEANSVPASNPPDHIAFL